MKENTALLYHYQADIDEYAKIPDLKARIIETTMQQIMESYTEFMQELLQEAQEAY